MGSRPRAILVYGVDVDYESLETLPWSPFGEDFDKPQLEDWAVRLANLTDPHNASGERWDDWYSKPQNQEKQAEYWRQRDEAVNQLPITEVLYDWDNQRLMIAVNGTVSSETWDGPSEAVTTVSPEQVEAAKAFCAEHGIGFENPKWLLVAEYN